MAERQDVLAELLEWVDERVESEVTHRPDVNIYKATLSQTWEQMRRKLSAMLLDAETRNGK